MDIGAMKSDLTKCLNRLPSGMVNPPAIAQWIAKNHAALKALIPDFVEILGKHVAAGMFEASVGAVDTEEIERGCIEALLAYGIQVPEENAPSGPTG